MSAMIAFSRRERVPKFEVLNVMPIKHEKLVAYTRPSSVRILSNEVSVELPPAPAPVTGDIYDWAESGDCPLELSVPDMLHGITPAEAGLTDYIVA